MAFKSSAAGRAYASQGRAVKQVARQQRRKAREPVRRYTPPASTRSDAASGGRNQMARAERFKGTRQYYSDYRQAFRANPKVETASRQIGAGARRAYPKVKGRPVKPTRAQSKTGLALILKGEKAFERELRRGPDKISNPIYGRYSKRLWGRARGHYPGSDKAPKLKIDYGPIGKSNHAWVFHDDPKTVHVSPNIVREFMNPKGRRPKAESVLLHEWAHTRQPQGARRPSRAVAEGGAEAVEQILARKLKRQYTTANPQYRKWRRKARKRGKGYVLKGQYQ